MASSSTSSSSGPSDTWISRTLEAQARSSPDVVLRSQERARSARNAQMSVRSVQMRSAAAYDGVSFGLRRTAALSARVSSEAAEWNAASGRAVAIMSAPVGSAAPPAAGPAGAAPAYDEAELAQADAAPAAAVASDNQSTLTGLLDQLRVEPSDDAEVSAKFTIFESYMSTVSTLRDEVYRAWEGAKGQFSPEGQADVQRSLARVDAGQHLGVHDVPDQWIVYGMMRQATANHGKLSSIMRDVETRLALLAQEAGDCPMCMERLACPSKPGGKPAKTLACCHRTCTDCWVHWVAVNHSPFCPLCRHVEFVDHLTRLASVAASVAGSAHASAGASAAGSLRGASISSNV